jgi:hypothetical protein
MISWIHTVLDFPDLASPIERGLRPQRAYYIAVMVPSRQSQIAVSLRLAFGLA